jgi:hypothetical protein
MTTDVGRIIRELREEKGYASRASAAKDIVISRGGRTRPISAEALRRMEINLSLPGPAVLNQIISRWGLDPKEAQRLRFAVHAHRQRRDGYTPPDSPDALGQDTESAVATTVGGVLGEMKEALFGVTEDEDEVAALLDILAETVETHVRANFR